MSKPDSFVMLAALMSDKLLQQSSQIVELEDHIKSDHAEMDEMQRTITDLRTRNDELCVKVQNLGDCNYRQEITISDLKRQTYDLDYFKGQCAALKQELLTIKYGSADPKERVTSYMLREGESLLRAGHKLNTIKGVRDVSGWGLKESKDYVEAYVLPQPTSQEESSPGTKPSAKLAKVG